MEGLGGWGLVWVVVDGSGWWGGEVARGEEEHRVFAIATSNFRAVRFYWIFHERRKHAKLPPIPVPFECSRRRQQASDYNEPNVPLGRYGSKSMTYMTYSLLFILQMHIYSENLFLSASQFCDDRGHRVGTYACLHAQNAISISLFGSADWLPCGAGMWSLCCQSDTLEHRFWWWCAALYMI